MKPLVLGAVSYLNTKPLVYGLDQRPDLFDVRFDVPAQCAALLHEGVVDLGLIPVVEYLRGTYAIVPGVSIASDGTVASVAVFSRVPIEQARTIALDVSSRTSVALTRVMCARRWGIRPEFVHADPDIRAMLDRADAALVIGDPALAIDPAALGVRKYDLGDEWKALTGLPFVYAVWAGRPGVASRVHCQALNEARDRGLANLDVIARLEGGGDAAREVRVRRYLSDNVKYGLGEAERAGLSQFHRLVVEVGAMPALQPLRFYE